MINSPHPHFLSAIYSIFLFVFCSFLSIGVSAAPSAEIPYTITQPDGSKFIAVTKGDEWSTRVENQQGYTVQKDARGNWRYVEQYLNGTAKLSTIYANEPPLPSMKKHIRSDKQKLLMPSQQIIQQQNLASPSGNFTGSVLYILAQFTDRVGSTTEASWATFVTTQLCDYYNKASHGKVTLIPATETSGAVNNGVVGWVTLNYPHPNTAGNTGTVNQQLAKDAILAANPFVNFAAYDTNNDGFVDASELAIVVIAAGYEASYTTSYTPKLWGHKWSISTPPVVDGKTVGSYHNGAGGYAQFGELHRSSATDQHQATLGIMAHELGHLIFGLPDLYDTDGSSSGIGAFCLMSGGSWGRAATDTWQGQTPVLPSAWIRQNRGWDTNLAASGSVSITASGATTANSDNSVYKITTALPNEYFLVENRQPLGYDRGLQAQLGSNFGGLAIWHIDDNKVSNVTDTHRWVDIEEADGTVMGTARGSATDLWYSGNATTYNDTSNPDSKLYNGGFSNVNINTISSSGTIMTAFIGTPILNPPLNLTATAVSSSQINLAWTDNSTNETGFKIERGTSATGPFSPLPTTTANTVSLQNTGLAGGTTYFYRVRATNTAGDSANSNVASATTLPVIPAAPSNLTAVASGTQINLAWTDNSTNETGFKIERGASVNGPFSPLPTTTANAVSFQNTGLAAGTYFYRVRATNTAGDSANSNVASATIIVILPPLAPSNLTAVASGTQINLAWTDNSTNETGFKIERGASVNGPFSPLPTTTANTVSFQNTGLAAGTYFYRVRATNTAGDSANSNVASATMIGTGPNLLTNGGFDTGSLVPWTVSSYVTLTSSLPQAGAYSVRMLGRGVTGSASMSQKPAFPAAGATKTLSFYLKMSSAEGTGYAWDFLNVRIVNSANTTLSTLASFSNRHKNSYTGWTLVTLKIPGNLAVTGNRLMFSATENSILQTTFSLDSVSIQ